MVGNGDFPVGLWSQAKLSTKRLSESAWKNLAARLKYAI